MKHNKLNKYCMLCGNIILDGSQLIINDDFTGKLFTFCSGECTETFEEDNL